MTHTAPTSGVTVQESIDNYGGSVVEGSRDVHIEPQILWVTLSVEVLMF